MRFPLILAGLALLAAYPAPVRAEDEFSDAQKAQIEAIVRDFLTKKEPDVVVKAIQAIEQKETVARSEEGAANVIKNKEALLSDAVTPVGGNPKGDVTIVEFFDYQCGYCKMVQETLAKMMAEDKKIRFIYKEFPVLGPNSTLASKAALASVKQGKYVKFHEALMGKKDHFTAEMIDQIAKDTGLNLEKLHKDMESDEVKKAIETTSALGRSIGARGTPTFVIGDKLFPGAMPIETLKQAVADARAAKK